MELWIRSQDKKILLKATIIKWENGCLRGATDEDCWYHDLGKYKKERALEVLDEIQNKLKNEDNDLINKLKILEKTPIINCSNNDDCEININIELLKNMIIYEMP